MARTVVSRELSRGLDASRTFNYRQEAASRDQSFGWLTGLAILCWQARRRYSSPLRTSRGSRIQFDVDVLPACAAEYRAQIVRISVSIKALRTGLLRPPRHRASTRPVKQIVGIEGVCLLAELQCPVVGPEIGRYAVEV